MNLHQKLVAIRSDIGGFTKDKKSFNYSYVSGTQVLAKIQDKMNELGVLLIPKVISQDFEKHEYKNSKGKDSLDFLVFGQMSYTWVNADDPNDFIEVPFYYTGAQDDISKAFGSGLTYSERYFVIKFFNLPTDADDPDARDTSGRSGNNGYQKQQAPPQQQYQQAPPQQASQQKPGMISPAQLKALQVKVKIVAAKEGKEGPETYAEVIEFCGIKPGTSSTALTVQEATKVIGYLATLEQQ